MFSDSAAELYRMVSGQDLDGPQRTALDEMLTCTPDGRWASPHYQAGAAGRPLLEARALAGLFLLDEDVLWSTHRSSTVVDTFHRMRDLIEGSDALRLKVRRVSAANGEQRITLHTGRRLAFGRRTGHGHRGLSVDCILLDERLADREDPIPAVALSLVSRPNSQLVEHDGTHAPASGDDAVGVLAKV